MAFQKNQKRKRDNSPTQRIKKQQKILPNKKTILNLDLGNEKGLECTIVNKNENIRPGFIRQINNFGNKNIADEMWVDKYRPKSVNKIVGQSGPQSVANKLKNWLDNWFKNKNVKPFYGKNDNGIGLRAALLSGPPGIGKTTTAQLVAKECGFEYTEFNASDTRNKKSMDEQVMTLLSNKTMGGFFHDPKNQTKMTGKHVLIMDEVDGMSGADRGGIAELIQFIKKTQIPIICICNDRNNQKIRNLANYCFDLRFQRPRIEQIRAMLLSICFKEGIKIDNNFLNEMIEMSNHDIRQVLHYFSIFVIREKNLDNIKNHKVVKDVTLSPFDAVNKIFTTDYNSMRIDEKVSLFFCDYQLMPLFAWENYIHCKPNSSLTDIDRLKLVTKSIHAICIGDLLETQIRTSQNWNFLPFQACLSTVLPGYYMNGHFGGRIEFPSFLGKISSIGRRNRLVQDLKLHMNLSVTGSKTCLQLDYIKVLRDKIILPLLKYGNEAISKAITVLNHYNLLKDDLDSIIELSLWGNEKNPFLSVDTKTKSAFTRAFNKVAHVMPYSEKTMIKKISGKDKKDVDLDSDTEDTVEDNLDNEILPDF